MLRRMSNPYAKRYEKRGINWSAVEGRRSDPRKEREARQRSDLLGMGAAAAPVVGGLGGALIGGLAGGPAGAAAGLGIGSGLGGLAGQGLGAAADMQTRKYDEEEARRRARFEAVAAMLGSMR